jgi:sugar phosphate isomerase/epimerase
MKWPKSITLRAFSPDQPRNDCLRAATEAGFDAIEVNLEPGLPYDPLKSSDKDIEKLRRQIH